jgi:hypothetical protein
MAYPITHLSKVAVFQRLAAGTVDGVYPRPVMPNTLLELAAFEATTTAEYVSVGITNSFRVSPDRVAEYEPMHVGKLSENDVAFNWNNESIRNYGRIHFKVTAKYAYESVYMVERDSVTELLLQMAKDGVEGTVFVSFHNYPNGKRSYAVVDQSFRIVL